MNLKEIAEKAAPIIFSHEGDSGSVNKNDNGALSVGRVQWHGSRALSLMRAICEALGAGRSREILGAALYAEITAKGTSWGTRKATTEEAGRLSAAGSKRRPAHNISLPYYSTLKPEIIPALNVIYIKFI